MDEFRIDSHKLLYHVPRVNDWLAGKNIYPVYMEISPMGTCNHRCTFCALDFMEYEVRYLDASILKEMLSEMGELGLKSVMYAGEGEPLLHKRIAEITEHTKKSGIDVAFTTNAVLLSKAMSEKILPYTEWIKVSINAGSRESYSKIHRAKPEDFDKVIKNMTDAVKVREENGYSCALGMQMVLLPDNANTVLDLAKTAKDIGIDYLVIKPYSHQDLSKTEDYKDIRYEKYLTLADQLKKFNDKNFNTVFRINTMKKWDDGDRSYNRCLALPFWSYIDSGGGVWGCSAYLGDDRFLYGNINESSFKKIWESEKRERSLKWIEKELDTRDCRVNCRMDEVNRYLWDLKKPPPHHNFI